MVTLNAVLALADPSAGANARLLPQLCPLHGCAEALIAKSMMPANPVSAAVAVRNKTGVPAQDSAGVNAVAVPVCVN